MKTSVIIPSFNHAHYLPAAIESCLAQTMPVEIIVVDDGSTDDTPDTLESYRDRITLLRQPNGGVAAARNAGLASAETDCVMFLDADDVIAPEKIERQLGELDASPDAGWVLCDVRIVDDISKQDELASHRYGYADMDLSGWIAPLLAERNFIPVHSPLMRRSAIGDARFPEGKLEDWAFWRLVADNARVRYIPTVLATYFKKRSGRNQQK